ncbi:trans-aconitate 2-methyltransferase [Nissabacter sp. SGAir0207]|uniref:trans-aconitate 2-methyltransferase n=1 Tax=Nissabacter sp. SGAir0207 TaxID=2126321 RepID=UPI0010CD14EF|nr:trans-aconitate 2-methyltransferase [Nissabacter sp. SGAir0207]QCR36638.1 trans-aconitate 2-methyltransferase [Nissabacter sp. SGAir0207]
MQEWNPELYRQFEAERTRPAQELLARVARQPAQHITDLGCGPANSTELLKQRYPHAAITGIDNSGTMLESARTRLPGCQFEQADIATWQPAQAQDLLYANASLQWLDDHARLLPRLMGLLAPGGSLAIQMPDNREEPTHRLMREVAARDAWREKIGPEAAGRVKILSAGEYYDLLAPEAESVDIWRTTYFHSLPSPASVVEWVRATGLRPFLAPLNKVDQETFLQHYQSEIDLAYPTRRDGRVLLAFPRLFIVARKKI